MHYLTSQCNLTEEDRVKEEQLPVDERSKVPALFIYPRKNYKTTIQKAPMAHKTFSQEQYMIRFYRLSITFHLDFKDLDLINKNNVSSKVFFSKTNPNNLYPYFIHSYPLNNVNNSMYYSLYLVRTMPVFSTNML